MAAGYSQQSGSAQSQSNQGLLPGDKGAVSAGARRTYEDFLPASLQAAADPGGLGYRSTADELLPVGRFGLAPDVDAAVGQGINQALSQMSGTYATRGFVSPESQGAIAGSAIQNTLPSLLPAIQQYRLQRAQLPTQLQQIALGYRQQPLSVVPGLLGGSSAYQSDQSGFGFNVAGGR